MNGHVLFSQFSKNRQKLAVGTSKKRRDGSNLRAPMNWKLKIALRWTEKSGFRLFPGRGGTRGRGGFNPPPPRAVEYTFEQPL